MTTHIALAIFVALLSAVPVHAQSAATATTTTNIPIDARHVRGQYGVPTEDAAYFAFFAKLNSGDPVTTIEGAVWIHDGSTWLISIPPGAVDCRLVNPYSTPAERNACIPTSTYPENYPTECRRKFNPYEDADMINYCNTFGAGETIVATSFVLGDVYETPYKDTRIVIIGLTRFDNVEVVTASYLLPHAKAGEVFAFKNGYASQAWIRYNGAR